jgi:2-oxoglutarate ferredoxin oxidoreductase subunit gamma
VIVDSDLVSIDPMQDPKPFSIPASRIATEMGRPVVANIVMLGFLAKVSDIVSYESLKEAILDSIPEGTEEFNMKAFDSGYTYGSEHETQNGNKPS